MVEAGNKKKNKAVCPLPEEDALAPLLYNSYKGVPSVNAAAGILARSKLPYHSVVQDGEANVTRIRGKQKYLFHIIDMGFS